MAIQVGLNYGTVQEQDIKGGAFSGVKWSGCGVFWLIGLLKLTSYRRHCHIYTNWKQAPSQCLLAHSWNKSMGHIQLFAVDLCSLMKFIILRTWMESKGLLNDSRANTLSSWLSLWLCWCFLAIWFFFVLFFSRFSDTTLPCHKA